jgi:hypothetical protein
MDDTGLTLPTYLFVEQRCVRVQSSNGGPHHLSFGGSGDQL